MIAVAEARQRFPALVGYVFQACLPRKRVATLAVPCGAILLFGLLTHVVDETASRAFQGVTQIGIIGLALPLGALVIGDAVMGSEIRSGTLIFTWLTPTSFAELAVARWLGGTLVAWATLVPAAAVAALVAGVPGAAWPAALSIGTGAAAHIAVFVFIGAATRRAAAWSLAIVFLSERLLGTVLTSVAQVSPTWEAQQVFATYGPDGSDYLRDGIPHGFDAIVRLGLITVIALVGATWTIRRLQLTGSHD